MHTGALIWFGIFAAAAAMFFCVAAVVSVKGWKDLKELLRPSSKK
jgi:hypothetical protein